MKYEKDSEGFHIFVSSPGAYFSISDGIIEINNKPLSAWIERNYMEIVNDSRLIKACLIDTELKQVLSSLFCIIKEISENEDDYLSANHTIYSGTNFERY